MSETTEFKSIEVKPQRSIQGVDVQASLMKNLHHKLGHTFNSSALVAEIIAKTLEAAAETATVEIHHESGCSYAIAADDLFATAKTIRRKVKHV